MEAKRSFAYSLALAKALATNEESASFDRLGMTESSFPKLAKARSNAASDAVGGGSARLLLVFGVRLMLGGIEAHVCVLMSALDFTTNPIDMMYLAQYMSGIGLKRRALQLFR